VSIEARRHGSESVLVVHGSLDAHAVDAVGTTLADLAPGARVTIDLHDVRICDDAALAVLARAATRNCTAHVELVGLSGHQERILRYMGIPMR
jgi:anti-anti-sigma factor